MKQLNLSTKMKAAVGYAAVIALFLAAVWLIVGVIDSLTRSDGAERTINNRQRATNDVVSQLYQAEVIGQALSAGQTDLFQSYVDAMMLTAQAVDSLRAIVNDRAQPSRSRVADCCLPLRKHRADVRKSFSVSCEPHIRLCAPFANAALSAPLSRGSGSI